jgi:glucan biosynthesis protein C
MIRESASRTEKSASRILDRARTDLGGLADCSSIRLLIVLVAAGPMMNVEQKPERLHALDAVRAYALLLGIILHATMSFIPAPSRIWMIQDSQPSITLGVLFFSIHVFRMTTFFLIAGFFAHLSFHRRGASGFIKDRLQRIALPLVVGWPILFTAMAMVVIWAASFPNGGPLPGPRRWPPVLPQFPLSHLWFLYVLLEFYVAVLVLRIGVVRLDPNGRICAGVDRLIGLVMQSRFAPAILAAPIGIALSLDPTWIGWLGVRTPGASLVTNLQALIGFATAFGFGWLLHRQMDLIRMLERRWLLNSMLAVVLIAASFFLAVATVMQPQPIGYSAIKLASAACYALAIWTTTFAAIGAALRFLSGYSATRRYLADASYWLYLIHLPILMALQVAVSNLDWPWPVKFATILLIALPLMLASYQFLVRYSFVGTMLNGRRVRRVGQIAPTAAKGSAAM